MQVTDSIPLSIPVCYHAGDRLHPTNNTCVFMQVETQFRASAPRPPLLRQSSATTALYNTAAHAGAFIGLARAKVDFTPSEGDSDSLAYKVIIIIIIIIIMVVVVVIIIIVTIIIIIALKGSFLHLLTAPQTFQLVCSSGQGTIVCKSCVAHKALMMCNMSCAM